MRIIRIIVAATLLLIAFAKVASADETINTETNTNTSSSIFNKYFATPVAFASEGIVQEEPSFIEKTPEEKQRDAILEKWKVKQAEKWSNLPKGKFTVNASAYTASADECGNSKGITASGLKVLENRTIACPAEFPFGAKINIEGYGTFTCEDRGGAIKGNKIDIYVKTKAEAFSFGRRNLIAEVVL